MKDRLESDDTIEVGSAPLSAVANSTHVKRSRRTVYLPALLVAAVSGFLACLGWRALSGLGSLAAVRAGQLHYAGPVVLGFVAVVIVLEQGRPAQRRPLLARGHVLDFGYLLAYALMVVPFVTLLGAGFAQVLEEHASWLVLPRLGWVPHWAFIAVGLVIIDAADWLVHLVNHKINPLWRMHAVHHSQEELSVLSTFRAHPLVHLSFLVTAVPGFVLAANAATPTTLLTAYACLGTIPHANLSWTYGPLRRFLISPAYHRIHHRRAGRLDVNLGVVFPFWDALSGRAIFPPTSLAGQTIAATGLAGRPIPVEQVGPARPGRLLAWQLLEPLTRDRPVPRSADAGLN